jgi:nucleolar protein 16
MGSVRQRRANKTSARKATRKNKDKQRKVNIASNPIIAANWDYSLTLAQNYKKLGLTSKLGVRAGGIEKDLDHPVVKETIEQKEAKKLEESVDSQDPEDIPEGEARIIRDDEGQVLKVIYGKKKPLNDDMELTKTPQVQPTTEVVKQLEQYASRSVKTDRIQSSREEAWIQVLYEKYGDDYDKMKWDKKLNIYQQSPGDLKKRVVKWKKRHGVE